MGAVSAILFLLMEFLPCFFYYLPHFLVSSFLFNNPRIHKLKGKWEKKNNLFNHGISSLPPKIYQQQGVPQRLHLPVCSCLKPVIQLINYAGIIKIWKNWRQRQQLLFYDQSSIPKLITFNNKFKISVKLKYFIRLIYFLFFNFPPLTFKVNYFYLFTFCYFNYI